MRVALLGLLAIILLGGGATGVYLYFGKKAEASIGDTAEHKQAKEAKKEKTNHKPMQYVELDALILPIVDTQGVNEIVSLVVTLEVVDEKNKQLVTQMTPRIKDAFIQDLYGVLNKHAALKGGVVQVGTVKERLLTVSNRVMGEGVVNDVLLQVVSQRPM